MLDNLIKNSTQITFVVPSKITPDSNQPRKEFSKLNELAETIDQYGLQSPILIRPSENGTDYTIISGERRWRAWQMTKGEYEKIPCIIKEELSQEEVKLWQLVENIQREDLNPIEEAKFYQDMLQEGCISLDELAEKLGLSKPSVSRMIKLNNLHKNIQEEVLKGQEASKSILYGIAKEPQEKQLELWKKYKTGIITNRDGIKKKKEPKVSTAREMKELSVDKLWKVLQEVYKKDASAIKKLIKFSQLEKLVKN